MPLFPILLLLFVSIPIIEIYILISIGSQLGAGLTIGIVILTAVIGAACVRVQGFSTAQTLQRQLQQGQMPAQAMFDGVVLLVAGLLLITPGFFTDAVGFLLLIPPLRKLMLAVLLHRFAGRVQAQWRNTPPGQRQSGKNDAIEGEYRHDDE